MFIKVESTFQQDIVIK